MITNMKIVSRNNIELQTDEFVWRLSPLSNRHPHQITSNQDLQGILTSARNSLCYCISLPWNLKRCFDKKIVVDSTY